MFEKQALSSVQVFFHQGSKRQGSGQKSLMIPLNHDCGRWRSAPGGLQETCCGTCGGGGPCTVLLSERETQAEKKSEVVCVDYKEQPQESANEGWGSLGL